MDAAIIDERCYSNGLVFERVWPKRRAVALFKDFPTGDTWDEAMGSLLQRTKHNRFAFPPKPTRYQLNSARPAAVVARQRPTGPADDIDK